MKNIKELIPDIYSLLKRKDGWFNDELAQSFSTSLAKRLQLQFTPRGEGALRLSKMGPQCPRALWHSVHTPELAEPMPAWAENKFSFGHMVEAWAITLAKAAGHSVEGEQDELVVDGVVGHRDCVVDGYTVDIKSCSSRMFKRFEDKSIAKADTFGYLDQLDGYTVGSTNDPLVRYLDKAYILAVDKQLGHMCLYEHEVRHGPIQDRIKSYKTCIKRHSPPPCECRTEEFGKGGNRCLDTKASYSSFKHCCFPALRTFIYSDGPVYLTKVVKVPDVPELNRKGFVN